MECIDTTIDAIKQSFSGLIFANLVDFDMLWGHRNDCAGFYKANMNLVLMALEEFYG